MVVVSDLGGVIINLNVKRCMDAFKILLGENFEKMGLQSDGEGKSLMEQYEKGLVSSEFFVASILEMCASGTMPEDVVNSWNSMLMDIPQERIDILGKIRSSGNTLLLLSNTNEIHWSHILEKYPDFESLFDGVFLSCREHLSKPDPVLFARVADSVKAEPQDLIFIDDLKANRDAALSLGWQVAPSLESGWN